MPVPKPVSGEDREIYLKRVLPELVKNFPQKQAVAIAMQTFRRRGKKKNPKKTRKLRLRKSFAQESAKLVLSGISLLAGNAQGDVYWDRKAQVARIVYKPNHNIDQETPWFSKLSEVLGIASGRISVSPQAPKEFGTGSSWIRLRPDGEVEIDPGLEVVVEDPVSLSMDDTEPTSFFYDKADENKFAGMLSDEKQAELRSKSQRTKLALGTLHATQPAFKKSVVQKFADKAPDEPALVIRQGGKDYIADGHHRLEADFAKGETHSDVALVILGEEPVIAAQDSARKAARLELSYDQRICKVDDHPDYTFVLGVVMVPEKFDNQGDIASVDVIERAAHGFIEESGRAGLMHKSRLTKREAAIVESHIVRSANYKIGDVDVPIGSWLVGMRVYDPQSRAAIKKGIFGGFSIGADADYNVVAG